MVIMRKRILKRIILCTALLTAGFWSDFPESRAATLHKLEYPINYGCCCSPNVQEFGYFRTTWREWPNEPRPDKYFPRSIGMERIPTPEGQEQLPLPKATVMPPGQPLPEQLPGLEGGALPPPGGIPLPELPPGLESPKQLPEPGKELQGLPPEPQTPGEGFKAVPGLPEELEPPPPLEPKKTPNETEKPSEPKSSNPGAANTRRQGTSVELRLVESKNWVAPRQASLPAGREKSARLPDIQGNLGPVLPQPPANLPASGAPRDSRLPTKPQANWNAALQPGTYGERGRSSWVDSTDEDLARPARYEESVDHRAPARRDSKIVLQAYPMKADVDTPPVADGHTPPLALKGYCPVELTRYGRWREGNPRFAVVYQGQIYRFSGSKERQQFLAAPENFIPACGGRDPVVLTKEKRSLPGQVNYCAKYRGRIYLFASEATEKEFQRHPERYFLHQ
jgi:YHS domain-containing protein